MRSTSAGCLYICPASMYPGGMFGAVFVLVFLPLLIIAASILIYRLSRGDQES